MTAKLRGYKGLIIVLLSAINKGNRYESKIEKAKQVFRKMLVDEYGIKSADQFFSTEGEAMAEIYESMKIEQENFNLTDDELNSLLDSIFDEM